MNYRTITLMATLAITAASLLAQQPLRGPDGGTKTRVSGVDVLAVPNAPFSSTTTTEWTRTLEDGTVIKTHLLAHIARDSKGRVYRERCSFVPANVDPSSHLNEVHIYDPVGKFQMRCGLRARQCVVSNYTPQTFFDTIPEGSFADGTRYLKREFLGTQTISGLSVTGTRETKTINPGVIGNDRALNLSREFWYNAELQTNLKVIRDEPGTGRQVITLSEISRDEPNPEIFKMPFGYTVLDTRSGKSRVESQL